MVGHYQHPGPEEYTTSVSAGSVGNIQGWNYIIHYLL
jgi:hypothetical protein